MKKILIWGLFALYMMVLIKSIALKFLPMGIVVDSMDERSLAMIARTIEKSNWMPLRTILIYARSYDRLAVARWNLVGNVALFLPMGVFSPLLFKRTDRFWSILKVGFLASLSFEVFQLVTGFGVFDVDDLILNTLGTLLGWGFYKLAGFAWKKGPRTPTRE